MVDTIPRLPDAVREALAKVQASSKGSHEFLLWDNARRFEEAVHDRYPALGYGTATELMATPGGFTVSWRVYSAD